MGRHVAGKHKCPLAATGTRLHSKQEKKEGSLWPCWLSSFKPRHHPWYESLLSTALHPLTLDLAGGDLAGGDLAGEISLGRSRWGVTGPVWPASIETLSKCCGPSRAVCLEHIDVLLQGE